MNLDLKIVRHLVPTMLIGFLAACASPNKPNAAGSGGHQASQGGSAGHAGHTEMMGQMDMNSMCTMHHNMMAKKTPEERDAMMNEHMKSMSPEMRRKHMAMMDDKCK